MRLRVLIVIFSTFFFCSNVLAYQIENIRREFPSRRHTELHADTSANVDCTQSPDTFAAADTARLAEWERRKKKENICKSMPRSQKWFKAKQQHVSPNQKRVYNDFWPVYGINLKYGSTVIPHELFPKFSTAATTPVVLDIGFGTGDSILGMSQQNTEKIYLGCEIHRAGISIVLGNLSSLAIENVKIIRVDVTMLLESYLKTRCLDEVCIFFPDPWPNTERDGERRVVRRDIIQMISDRMRPGGLLRIATDVPAYAEHVQSVLDSFAGWKLNSMLEHLPGVDGPSYRPVTRYEKKAVDLSNRIWDFEYVYE